MDRTGLPGERLHVLPLLPVVNAPEPAAWVAARRVARRSLGVVPGTCVVASVGACDSEQGRVFARVVTRLERRDVIGLWLDIDTPVSSRHWDGRGMVWANGSEAVQLLAAMDVLVATGTSGRAHAPSIDAMRAGIPVVTTGREEASALGQAGAHAVLVPRRNVRALSNAIAATIDRHSRGPRLPSAQLWRSVAHSPLRLLRTTVECYEAALGSTLPGSSVLGVAR